MKDSTLYSHIKMSFMNYKRIKGLNQLKLEEEVLVKKKEYKDHILVKLIN